MRMIERGEWVAGVGLALVLGLVAGCGRGTATPMSAPAAPRSPALPAGVLARVVGLQGSIEVVEHAGQRLLVIDGVVQGGAPIAGVPAAADPAAALVRALRPAARRALVIGLGTGRTATDLAAAGFAVEVIELEPAVVELARLHFGYRGHAVVGDGIAYLAAAHAPYDVILVDAFTRQHRVPALSEGAALTALVGHLADDGVLGFRFVGEPDRATLAWAGALRREVESTFVALFGSGVGAEPQNLVAIASRRPLNLVDRPELALWPVWHEGGPELALTGRALDPPADGTTERRVHVIGYVIKLESGELALDLPHDGMGAVRYLLSGGAAAALGQALPEGARFPDDGELDEAPGLVPPMRDLLGGGGALRSDTRFSPLVAAIEGRARFRSLISPDAAGAVPEDLRRGAPTDARVRRGGALYDLEVDTVAWTLDLAGLATLLAALAPHKADAIARAGAGDLAAAAAAMIDYLAVLEARFGAVAPRLRLHLVGDAWRAALIAEASATDARPLSAAARCDRAVDAAPAEWENPQLAPLRDALTGCALRNYRVALASPADAPVAAARMLTLIEAAAEADGVPARLRAALRKELKALRNRFLEVNPALEPPPR